MPKKRKPSRFRKKVNQKKWRKYYIIAGIALLVIVAIWGFSYFMLYRYVHRTGEDVILDHISIESLDVSGKTSEEAKKMLEEKQSQYGQLLMTLGVKEETVQVAFSDLGFRIVDLDEAVEKAVSYGKKGGLYSRYRKIRELEKSEYHIDVQYEFQKDLVETVVNEQLKPLEIQPVNATLLRENGAFVVQEGMEGEQIDFEQSMTKMNRFLNEKWEFRDSKLKMVMDTTEPRIKAEELTTIQDLLGSYQTEASGDDRIANIKRATELINGTVLMPGDELSVENLIAPITEENGYVKGSAYENGEVVESIGGGLCQMSSTLYNAVLYAELEVTLRYAHSMIVTYVEPSRDAAIAEGVKDFKFVNSYSTPILIEGYMMDGNMVCFNIYGKEERDPGHQVEYESETLEKTKYTTKYVGDSNERIGYMEREGSAINGQKARLWKVVTENGTEVSRDVINNSQYSASVVKIVVGTKSDNSEASSVVKNAISSQDYDKITSAISKARGME